MLHGGTAALAVASGHAAQQIVFHTLMKPGDRFVAARQLYGGSINQFTNAFQKFGWHVDWADMDDPASIEAAIGADTKAIFVESFANPAGNVTDLKAIAEIAERHHVPLVVDNTMATPYLVRPIEHGADIVVESLTKFMGGHGTSMGGVIVDGGNFDWSKDDRFPTLSQPVPDYGGLKIHEALGPIAFAIAARVLGLRDLGPAISPFNAFLILQGIETLSLRMQRHCDNALQVATYLEGHDAVDYVNYAGLASSDYNALAKRYAPNGAGAVFTFGLKGGYDAGHALVTKVKLFSHLANIGDAKSLVIHPASTTHSQLTDAQRLAAKAGPEMIRVSIGIEDAADIIADLEQALS